MGFLMILLGLPATTGGVGSGVPTFGSTSLAGSVAGSSWYRLWDYFCLGFENWGKVQLYFGLLSYLLSFSLSECAPPPSPHVWLPPGL